MYNAFNYLALPFHVELNTVMKCCHGNPTGSRDVTLNDLHILDNSNLFVWDGKQVGQVPVRTGEAFEPVCLRVTYPHLHFSEEEEEEEEEGERGREVDVGRPKDSTLGELRVHQYCVNMRVH